MANAKRAFINGTHTVDLAYLALIHSYKISCEGLDTLTYVQRCINRGMKESLEEK